MATVFTTFKQISYDYLEISRGNVYGLTIKSSRTLRGVFKQRNGMVQGEMELAQSSATLHVHPEDFAKPYSDIVGNGVKVGDDYYQITGLTVGHNFETGIDEHITLTLGIADYAAED